MGDDGRLFIFRSVVIFIRKFYIKDKLFQYLIKNIMYKIYVDVYSGFVGLFKVYYIYGFEYENYIYFILV